MMAFLYHTFGICVLITVFGQWSSVAAATTTSSVIIIPSSTARINVTSMASQNTMAPLYHSRTLVPSHNVTPTSSHNMTSIPSHNMTSIPSHNMTTIPSHNMTIAFSHNMTITPSHSMTVMPSRNMTVTPSHNMTVMLHNKTIMPSHNRTIMPSSAHTVMPTSSARPTPPPPKPGNFTVSDQNKTVCLFAYMAAKFDIKIGSKRMPSVVLPVNAAVTGACDKSSKGRPYISLQWDSAERYSYNFTMYFVIVKGRDLEVSSQRWAAANLTLSMGNEAGSVTETFHSGKDPLTQLSAHAGFAYKCATSGTDFKLMANNSTVNVSLTDIEFQPFEVKSGHLSKNVDVCATSTPPPATTNPTATSTPEQPSNHSVAIAVGCTLAGLVVIGVIGYLIYRRRNSLNSSAGYRKL